MAGRTAFLFGCEACAIAAELSEAPFLDIDLVVDEREHPPAANPALRHRQLALPGEAVEQLVEKPGRDLVALARVYPPEVQQLNKQHLPMHFHVGEKPVPIDLIMCPEHDVSNISAVIAMAELD